LKLTVATKKLTKLGYDCIGNTRFYTQVTRKDFQKEGKNYKIELHIKDVGDLQVVAHIFVVSKYERFEVKNLTQALAYNADAEVKLRLSKNKEDQTLNERKIILTFIDAYRRDAVDETLKGHLHQLPYFTYDEVDAAFQRYFGDIINPIARKRQLQRTRDKMFLFQDHRNNLWWSLYDLHCKEKFEEMIWDAKCSLKDNNDVMMHVPIIAIDRDSAKRKANTLLASITNIHEVEIFAFKTDEKYIAMHTKKYGQNASKALQRNIASTKARITELTQTLEKLQVNLEQQKCLSELAGFVTGLSNMSLMMRNETQCEIQSE